MDLRVDDQHGGSFPVDVSSTRRFLLIGQAITLMTADFPDARPMPGMFDI
jgi:hypothetical protein